ncbi:MAG TPA: ABC transporter permease [Blastocatellia bacterium]|nr:ABC transporter permease [Blastocatellia bacterium]
METLIQDLRYGVWMLLKRPGFTAVVVLVLALGIGANSAFFSVISGVLIRPVPWEDPDRIANVWETNLKRGEDTALVSAVNFLDWRDQNRIFEYVAGWRFLYLNLTGRGEPERLQGLTVSPDYFPLLKVKAALGRTFLPEEEQPGLNKVAILSHGLWQHRFDSDPGIIGQQIAIEGEPYTVVGVLPSDFRIFRVLNRELDIYIPLTLDRTQLRREGRPSETGARGDSDQIMFVYARLKSDVSLKQAQEEMNTLYRRLEQEYPAFNSGVGVKLVSLPLQWSEGSRSTLLMLLAAVGFVLLIACANAANLLLARTTVRKREMAIRVAVGASRLRLIRQLLTESLLMALLSGAAGLLLALWGIDLLNGLIPYSAVNRAGEFRLDVSVLVFNLMISLLTGVIFGIAPALRSSRLDLTEALKEVGGGAHSGAGGGRLRNLLVISEITLSVVLLIGAGLMIRSVLRLHLVDRGVNTNNVLTMQVFLPKAKYPGGHQVAGFYQQVLQRIQTLPGVESASTINYPPLGLISPTVPFVIEGRTPPAPESAPVAHYAVISPDYFNAVGIPLLAGRRFTEQDADEARGVVVISASMARRYWPDEDPVGKRIRPQFPQMRAYWVPESNNLSLEIVGVVGDVKQDGMLGVPQGELNMPQIYLPYLQNPSSIMHLIVRTPSDPAAWAAAVRQEVYAVDNDQPVFDVKTLEEVAAESFSRPRVLTFLLSAFSALALILAVAGIYCVMSYSVTQRTQEIGIRMTLGAEKFDVLKLVARQGMTITITGIAFGLISAFAVTRVMSKLLYGVGATDPMTFIGVPVLFIGVAFVATYLPARKATKVDPIIALRYE